VFRIVALFALLLALFFLARRSGDYIASFAAWI
jgi:hypothetical protein